MKILTIIIIAILVAFSFYTMDMMNRMNADIKFIRMQIEKK